MQCSRERSVRVGWGIYSFCLFACFLPPSRDSLWLLRCVCVHFEPVLACKKHIQQGETCWVRQGYGKRQSWNRRWFTHCGTPQDHFCIIFFCWHQSSLFKHFETLTQTDDQKLLHVVLIDFRVKEGGRKVTLIQIGLRKVKQRTVFQRFSRKYIAQQHTIIKTEKERKD